jgi:HAD superfamily hydrolase (TIGR01509 family)
LSFEVGAAKPEPAIYEAVCHALGKRPRDVLFIGDSKRCDFDGPQAFGMQARWLDRRGGQSLVDALKGVL